MPFTYLFSLQNKNNDEVRNKKKEPAYVRLETSRPILMIVAKAR